MCYFCKYKYQKTKFDNVNGHTHTINIYFDKVHFTFYFLQVILFCYCYTASRIGRYIELDDEIYWE